MAQTVVSGIFTTATYTADRGVDVPALGFRFKLPHDFTDANAGSILTALGARRKTAADKNLCPVSAGDFKPRRVTFVRRSGNSLSLPFPDIADIVSRANQVKGIIDGVSAADPVACALLNGEEWADLVPELRASGVVPAQGKSTKPPSGGKQPFHSGKILYEFDGGSTTVPISVKVSTDAVTAGVTGPPTIIAAAWATCVGPFEVKLPCSSSDSWKHRRYILVSRVTDDIANPSAVSEYQSLEVPIKNRESAEILACGTALASLPSTICLKYRGESNGRFHVLLT